MQGTIFRAKARTLGIRYSDAGSEIMFLRFLFSVFWRAFSEGSLGMSAASVNAVPLCDLNIQYREIQDEVEAAVTRVLRSGQVILGEEVARLENELAEYCNSRYAPGCGSGTMRCSWLFTDSKSGLETKSFSRRLPSSPR